MKKIYLSHFLNPDTPFYGGDGTFQFEMLRSMESGDSCNAALWSFPNHAGTHIDFPWHFCHNGRKLHDYSADFWNFCTVALVDLSEGKKLSEIGPQQMEDCRLPSSIELLLIKTGHGFLRAELSFWQDGPIFRPELADYLRESCPKLRAIGMDTISISSWRDRTTGREAHRAFLCGTPPILLIEDMDLTGLNRDSLLTTVTITPLLVYNADASPCTVIAEIYK